MNIAEQRLLQVWTWPTEDGADFTGALALAQASGATGVLVKGLDGISWQSGYNHHPDAIDGPELAAEQRAQAHAAGLSYCAWTNPLFDVDRIQQAVQTAALANVCDALFLDVEPYARFWGAWRPEGAARAFMERVRAGAPDAVLVLQPDPRPGRLAELRPEEWLPYVNALSGQHYFETFQTDAEVEATAALRLGDSVWSEYSLPILPTLPGAAGAVDMRRAVDKLEAAGVRGRVLWRLGVTGAETLAAFGAGAAVAPLTGRERGLAMCDVIWGVAERLDPLASPYAQQLRDAAVAIKEAAGWQ